MHALMVRVLEGRQLNSAGQLFSISDYDVITDLHSTFSKIKAIFNAHGYVSNSIDREVVSIVITRITAAIRTTGSIETYCAEMVDVLDSALRHAMTIYENGEMTDSPHCKIATELISSLFLHYSKKSVMTLSIPAALQALSTGHTDLVRSTTSYLSLAAIYNSRALAHYTLQITSLIIAGNYSLCRVLPQIYSENREPVHAHLPQLLRLLDVADPNDRLSLIMLASIVANHKPNLLLAYLPSLVRHLLSTTTCTAVLHILNALVAQGRTNELADFLPLLCAAIGDAELHSNHASLARIIATLARPSLSASVFAMQRLVECATRYANQGEYEKRSGNTTDNASTEILPVVLSQIESLGETYPQTLAPHLDALRALKRMPGVARQIDRILSNSGIVTDDDITIISIRSVNFDMSLKDASSDSLSIHSKRSLQRPSTTSTLTSQHNNNSSGYVTSGTRTSFAVGTADASALELDKNTQNLASIYQNRSSSSLSKQWSRSYGSVLQGIAAQRGGSEAVANTPAGAPTGSAGSRGALSTASVTSSSSHIPRGSVPVHMLYPPSTSNYGPPPKTQTLPSSFNPPHTSTPVDGRSTNNYRPIPPSWVAPTGQPPAHYETTFPATGSGPVTTKMAGTAIEEEGEREDEDMSEEGRNEENEEERRQQSTSGWKNDVVRQFVDNRRSKITRYVMDAKCPIPIQCTVERGRSGKHHLRVHFACQTRHPHCIFRDDFLFAFKTKNPATWLHLMFLQMQSSSIQHSREVVGQDSPSFSTLQHCWNCLPSSLTKSKQFVALVTSAFPPHKEQEKLVKELEENNFFDCFSLDIVTNGWSCFSCAHPERVKNFVEERTLEGQLKEKKGKWKFLRRWQTKYFTLSPGTLTYSSKKNNSEAHSMLLPTIDLKKIRSVKSLGRGKKGRKSLRKAFEIFTSDQTSYILKAADEKKAEEWMQCLQIAVAQAKRES